MAKGKVKSIFVKLLSGAGTGFFYVTRKNPKNVPERLTLRKYDPVVVSRPAHRPRSAPAPPQPRDPTPPRPRAPPAFKPSRAPVSAPPRPRLAQTLSHLCFRRACRRLSAGSCTPYTRSCSDTRLRPGCAAPARAFHREEKVQVSLRRTALPVLSGLAASPSRMHGCA